MTDTKIKRLKDYLHRNNQYSMGNKGEVSDRYKMILDIIIVYSAIIIIGGTLGNIIVVITGTPQLLSQIIFQSIGIIIISLRLRHNKLPDFSQSDDQLDKPLIWSLSLWLNYIGLFYLIGEFIQLLIQLFEDVTVSSYENLASGYVETAMLALVLVVLAPIFEELIFRKYVYSKLLNTGFSKHMTVFYSIIIFALVHTYADIRFGTAGYVIQHFVLLLGSGLVFGLIYLRTGRIIYPILVHMISNLYGSLPLIFREIFPISSKARQQYEANPDTIDPIIIRNIKIENYLYVSLLIFSIFAVLFFVVQLYRNYSRWTIVIRSFIQDVVNYLREKQSSWILLAIITLGFVMIPYIFLILGRTIDNTRLQFLEVYASSLGYGTSFTLAILAKKFIIVTDTNTLQDLNLSNQ